MAFVAPKLEMLWLHEHLSLKVVRETLAREPPCEPGIIALSVSLTDSATVGMVYNLSARPPYAERPTRPKTPCRFIGCAVMVGRIADRRNYRSFEGTFRQGPLWKCGLESARRKSLTGGTHGHRQEGGGIAVGLAMSKSKAKATNP